MHFSAPICFLNTNDGHGILAVGNGASFTLHHGQDLKELDDFVAENKERYLFGYLSYSLYNHVFEGQENSFNLPLAHFWAPASVASIHHDEITMLQGTDKLYITSVFNQIKSGKALSLPHFKPRTTKEEYLNKIRKIKEYIQRGDIYETNFCMEYFVENYVLPCPASLYQLVNQATQAPFSALLHLPEITLACGSPERFIQKKGKQLLSQPIKGTAPRMKNALDDEKSKQSLLESKKERAENAMIVDLVRNDLSKIALPNSVQVDELFGLYSFKTVHQMISSISCEVDDSISFSEIIKATFPMGSMTGAPKRNAIRFMLELEDFNREIYSGSIGYIKPGGDFDFNVVIRSIAYLPESQYLSCSVGSAITIQADEEEEYAECLLKINRLISILDDEST